MKRLLVSLCLLATTFAASNASAFCGFYVGGAGADLFNDASQVETRKSQVDAPPLAPRGRSDY